jgi:hypothetical protein
MIISNKNLRSLLRLFHLVAGGLVVAYFYSPLAGDPTLAAVIKFPLLPALVLTGLWMWQMPRINQWLGRHPARRQARTDLA